MAAREDSVLTSLNELRRLKNERRRRDGGGKGRGRRAHGGRGSGEDQVTPPVAEVTPPPRSVGHTGQAARGRQGAAANAFAPPATGWAVMPEAVYLASPQMAKPSSSAKPAIIVAVVMLALAAGGYVKLDADWKAQFAEKEAAVRRVEETRGQAVEAAVRAERQALAQLKTCEGKNLATAAPAAPAPPAVAASAAPTYPPRGVSKRSRARGRSAARSAAVQPVAAPAPSSVPTIPKKKALGDDPLAGIKI